MENLADTIAAVAVQQHSCMDFMYDDEQNMAVDFKFYDAVMHMHEVSEFVAQELCSRPVLDAIEKLANQGCEYFKWVQPFWVMGLNCRYDDDCSNSFFQLTQHSDPQSLGLENIELVAQKVHSPPKKIQQQCCDNHYHHNRIPALQSHLFANCAYIFCIPSNHTGIVSYITFTFGSCFVVLVQVFIRELVLVIVYFERNYYAMVQSIGNMSVQAPRAACFYRNTCTRFSIT